MQPDSGWASVLVQILATPALAKASRVRAVSAAIHRPMTLTERSMPSRGTDRAGERAANKQADNSITTLDEEDAITDQPDPHDQHDSELQLVLTIGIEGFRELVAWVAEGTTAEDRHTRGSTVRQVIDDLVKNVDSAKINQALLDEASRLRKEAQ
jgi:hypothetical protein